MSWNLSAAQEGSLTNSSLTPKVSIAACADALKRQNPDVILIQNIEDWARCNQLVSALKPIEYHILICSSFRGGSGAILPATQVAILSRHKAYFSWAESWKLAGTDGRPGGYAFAAVEIGQHRAAFISVLWPSSGLPGRRLAWHQQLLEKVSSVRNWEVNRVEAFLVGATTEAHQADPAMELLRTAGFLPVTSDSLAETGGPGTDMFLVEPAGLCTNLQALAVGGSARRSLSCLMDLTAAVQQRQALALAPPAAATNLPSAILPFKEPQLLAPGTSQPPEKTRSSPRGPGFTGLGVGAFGLGFVLIWCFCSIRYRRTPARKKRPAGRAALTPVSQPYLVVTPQSTTGADRARPLGAPAVHLDVPTVSPTHTQAAVVELPRTRSNNCDYPEDLLRTGLIAHLRQWLKNMLVRKLIADRSALLDVQRAATLKTMQVEERLARIESQMHKQNQIYQRRIDELGKELAAAREENRELIRTRISQIKAEMETAKARFEVERQQAAQERPRPVSAI